MIPRGVNGVNFSKDSNNSNSGVGDMSDVQFGETLDALLDFGGLNDSPPPSGDNGANSFEPLNCDRTCSDATLNPAMLTIKPLTAVNLAVSAQQQQQILPNPTITPQKPLHLNPIMLQSMQASLSQRTATGNPLPPAALPEQFAFPVPPGLVPAPSRLTSAAVATKSTSTSEELQTTSHLRKRPAPEEISEDETERVRRREERNLREQKRSQQITTQIERLRQVLSDANVPFKTDKYSTLTAVVQYVKQLQARSTLLDAEHRKLLQTIVKASELANNRYMPTNRTSTPVLAKDLLADSSRTSSPVQDDAAVMVNGIDYKSVFKSCPFASSLASIDGRFIDCNKEFAEASGYDRQELLRGDVATVEDSKQVASSDSASSISSPSVRNMSLFNVLKRKDMESIYIAMSDMLKRGSITGSQAESDTWTGNVEFCRVERKVGRCFRLCEFLGSMQFLTLSVASSQMRIGINLIRSDQGTPRFFSVVILPA